jgi:Uma2 family endonuclease
MTVKTAAKNWTDAEFMVLPEDEHRYELVNGELIDMGNSGMEHGYLACILTVQLGGYIQANKLGVICDSSTAFTLKNGNKRSPDISFISRDRLQGLSRPPKGFFEGSPDLVVEILSPGNTVAEMHEKITEYFENETRLLWKIDPNERCVLVYRGVEPDRLLRMGDRLEGEDVVPGFSMAIAELFEQWDF